MSLRVSFIIPARNEETSLSATLESLQNLDTECSYEIIVVDGNSTDQTPKIARSFGVQLINSSGKGISQGRNAGAAHAQGDWLAFIDADTCATAKYLESMLEFVEAQNLVAATSRYQFTEPRGVRPRIVEATQPMLAASTPPILYGFNTFVVKDVFTAAGGYPNLPNEDIAFSEMVAKYGMTGVCPETLVRTSPRRLYQLGVSRTLWYYVMKDLKRRRSGVQT